jgi:HK97 family phage portal protein
MGRLARIVADFAEKRTFLSGLKTISPAMWDQLHLSSAAGPVVTENTALKSSAVLGCVKVIAETLASLPAHAFRQDKAGKVKIPKHPVHRIIHDRPNPLMTPFIFKETIQAHLLLWGNGYAEIVRDGRGNPVELWPIPPIRVPLVQRDDKEGLLYTVLTWDNEKTIIPARNMFHIPALGFDGFLGKSPIRLAAESIGLGLAAEEFTSRFFSNGATMSGVLMHPAVLGAEARKNLQSTFREKQTGLPNAFRMLLLEEGLKWQETGMKLVDAQLMDLRKFQVSDVARIFRVPLHLIQEHEKTTSWGTGIESFNQAFVMFCMRPWAVRWEETIQQKLFRTSEIGHFVQFSFDALLRGELKTRYEAYHIAKDDGWLNADEIREYENLNPIGGDVGQTYLWPLNFAPAGPPSAAPEQPIQSDAPGARGDFRPLLDAAWGRITRRAGDEVSACIARIRKSGQEPDVRDAMSDWLKEHQDYVEAQLAPIVAAGWRPGSNGNGTA